MFPTIRLYLTLLIVLCFFANCNIHQFTKGTDQTKSARIIERLRVSRSVGQINFAIQYIPKALTSNSNNYVDNCDFKLRITTPSPKTPLLFRCASKEEFYKRKKYFSFDFQQDIFLATGKDTVVCKKFHLEGAFENIPYLTFHIGFENIPKNREGAIIIIKDRMLAKQLLTFELHDSNLQEKIN